MSNFALSDDAVVLGFDPGGGRSFGAAVLSRSEGRNPHLIDLHEFGV